MNQHPTGSVSIGGTTTQKNTLTANNNLADADGLGTLSYQWQSSSNNGSTWADISGATASTFVLTQAQVGLKLKVVVRYTDGFGTAESVASGMTAAIGNVNDAPVNTVPTTTLAYSGTGSVALTGLSVSDPDSTDTLTVTLAVQNGTLSVGTGTGVTVSNNNTATVKLVGTGSAISTLLAGNNALTYTAGANYAASGDTLTMTSKDAALTDVDSFQIAPQTLLSALPTLSLGTLSLREGLNNSAIDTAGTSKAVDASLFNVTDDKGLSASQIMIDIQGGNGFGTSTSFIQNSHFYRIGSSPVTVVSTIQGDSTQTTENTKVTFSDLAGGQSVSIGGLSLSLADGSTVMTAAEVAAAFASLSNGGVGNSLSNPGASFSGTLLGWKSDAMTENVTFTSSTANTNVPDLSTRGTYGGVSTVSGGTLATEATTISFSGLTAGQFVTVGGLTLSLSAGSTAMTAAEVAAAFASLTNGGAGNSLSHDGASFSGALSGWSSGAVTEKVSFSSSTANTNVTDLVLTGNYAAATTVQGDESHTESSVLQFGAMLKGDVVQVGGLNFTASQDLTAAQVAGAFAGLGNNATSKSGISYGSYSGALGGWMTSAVTGDGTTLTATHYAGAYTNYVISDIQVASEAFRFSLQDVIDGKIGFYYNGAQDAPGFSVRVGTSSSTVSSSWQQASVAWRSSGDDGAGGHILFGDGSGASVPIVAGTLSGYQGGGSNDNLAGSANNDIVFADGSGGAGSSPLYADYAVGSGGRGGSGNDTVVAGAGNDLLFGDGFAGGTPARTGLGTNDDLQHWSSPGAAGGYGGGGGGTDMWAPISSQTQGGIGAGNGAVVQVEGTGTQSPATSRGEVNSIGVPTQPNGQYSYPSYARAAANGDSVSALGNATGKGDDLQVDAYLTDALYAKVLADLNNTGSTIWQQVMGMGNDSIDAGAGDDWVLGGYGNDTIVGGTGNDQLWGCGGAAYSFVSAHSDGIVAYSNGGTRAEVTIFSFTSLGAGESVMIGGLTLTAKADMTAEQVAAQFQGLNSSTGAVTPNDTVLASFQGELVSGWSTTAKLNNVAVEVNNRSSTQVAFTASVGGPVTHLSYTAPTPPDNDTFVWQADDAGTGATDTLRDFTAWNDQTLKGDKLDISALLQGFTSGSSNLSQWVTLDTGLSINGTANSSRLSIDIDGAGSGTVTQVINLQGTDLSSYTLDQLVQHQILKV